MTQGFDKVVNRKGTFCTQWDYIEDRFGEKDLLPFSISDMDFPTPKEILQALESRLQHGVFGYTRWNHEQFKDAIRNWYQKRFSSTVKEEWIVYSPSVIYSISKMIEILSEEADHIVIQTPAYDAFYKTIKDNMRIISRNELIYHEGIYSIDFTDLEEKLAHPKSKVLLLCSPHNPTGRVWKKEELEKIVHLCNQYDVFIISDEIHMDVIHEGNTHIPITDAALNLDKVCICTSASKTFNTPGLGGSYSLIPNEKLREAFLLTLKNKDGLSSASIFGTLATITAYNECEVWVDDLVEYIDGNLQTIQAYLEEHLPDLQLTMPESTYLAWIDVSQLPFSSEQLQYALVHHGKVAIMSGETYGEAGKSFIRMNIGCPQSKVIEGLQRLNKAIKYLEEH
ncbi:MalY/PatB family protein [Lederbergia lenta]|uniref:cysteine-S-conjugate beta-lyase n=1 Tax=Lederbergia lenta TaxID=1467 RepID=A0A2X4W1B5_LEDLE|nr:MalY/PatB family protein [Lederbergia lenta]MEC2323507.1 pyridoxal phosphate-dependent aminotransferase [Lederbergia lenta]SQI52682.1 aminotransferase [Lederbergia lenta]